MSFPDLIGIVGISFVLLCYLLVQADKMSAVSPRYQILNMIGCLLILYSLIYEFNLPSAIIQIVWFLISGFGLIKHLMARRG